MADQDIDQKTDIPSEAEELDEEIEKESSSKNQESSKKDGEASAARGDGERGAPSSARNEVRTSDGAASQQDPEQQKPEPNEQSEGTQKEGSLAQEPKQEPPEPSTKDNPNAKWYVVHTYAGHENKVATGLKQRIESEHLEDKILDLLVPTQDKIEIRAGKKETVKEKIFPGYILIKMVLDDGSWLAVRTTPGVTSFVGMGNKPTPISDTEVKSIVQYMKQGAPATFKDVFLPDDTVKIIDGPFSDFIGKVDTVDKEKGKVRVLVSIFGRETPVELDFLQVTKL